MRKKDHVNVTTHSAKFLEATNVCNEGGVSLKGDLTLYINKSDFDPSSEIPLRRLLNTETKQTFCISNCLLRVFRVFFPHRVNNRFCILDGKASGGEM